MTQTIAAQLTALAVPIESVVPHPRNVNQGDIGAISQSLAQFAQYAPIVVQRSTGHIVKGNHTYLAACALGWTEIAANIMDLDDTQALAILVGDNRHSELGTRDQDALSVLLTELAEAGALEGTGYDGDDVDALLAELAGPIAGLTDPDAVPGVQDEPITKPGDLWVLGRHRLLCGDSTNPQHLDTLMDGSLARMLFTDPPYSVDYVGKTADALTISGDDTTDAAIDALALASGVLEPGSGCYITFPAEHLAALVSMWSPPLRLQSMLVWVKDSMVMGRKDYHYAHEPIWYGWIEGAAHRWYGERNQTTTWEIDRPQRSTEHPTTKPTALITKALENSSNPGDIVLDLFGGSGSTLIAAEQTGRTAYLMELDPKYCDVIVRRWELFTGQTAVREVPA